jgi:DNA-directed RNA polymerase subunit RPC12/RpoP
MVRIYKCPNCGGNMLYDPEQRILLCENCGTTKNPTSFEEEQVKSEDNEQNFDGIVSYKCPSCGAELVTDKYTAATSCAYCGSPNIIEERLSGNFKPSSIIPFEINRENTIKQIKKWCHNGIFTPSDFLSKKNLDNLSGIYVPFWLYDFNVNASMQADCTKVHITKSGDSTYTTTINYHANRETAAEFTKVPADASIKMDDELMDKLEPFNYYELEAFNMGYISGFIAEKYNYSSSQLANRSREKVEKYAYDLTRDTIQGYDSVRVTDYYLDSFINNTEYTLLPVWLYEYNYNNNRYYFAMNGQTGKVTGKPPVSKIKLVWIYFVVFIAVFLFIKVVIYYLGGGF